jgi:hypothetical protein
MNRQPRHPLLTGCAATMLLITIAAINPIGAQGIAGHATSDGLEYLVGPYALYPDDLLATVLAASAHPTQLAEASRFVDGWGERGGEVPAYWHDAVVALIEHPDVIDQLATDLDNTRQLGDAVVRQHEKVTDAVNRVRALAHQAGSLSPEPAPRHVRTGDTVTARADEDDVIWVPDCEPSQMTLSQRDPPYRNFPRPCAVFYYPYPEGTRFSSLHFWGATGWFSIGSGVLDFFSRRPWNYRSPYVGFPHPDRSYRPPSGYVPVLTRQHQRSRQTAGAVAQTQSERGTTASRPQNTQRTAAPSRSPAPWAAAAQRHTHPEGWRHGDVASVSGSASRASAGARTASRGGMPRPRATVGSAYSPARSATSAGRSQVQRSGMAHSTAGRQRRQ